MMGPTKVLESYSAMMALGLLLGVVSGGLPILTKEVSMASLALLMTLSLSNVRFGEARGGDHVRHAAVALALNYGMLTAVILLLGRMFPDDLWWGWVLMAAAPSAVSVVPFTSIMGGRTSKALFSTSVNYVAALGLMPLISLAFIGSAVSVDSLVVSLLVLIVVPMALSRLVARVEMDKRTKSVAMNLSFAVLIFAVAGSNRGAFFDEPWIVLAVSAASFARTFGTGLGTEYALRALKVPKEERVSSVLFASYKNLGLTATLAIALFEPRVAVPATICIVFEVVWVIFLSGFYRRARR
jgi:BASS family bile acid:Na+ symporter